LVLVLFAGCVKLVFSGFSLSELAWCWFLAGGVEGLFVGVLCWGVCRWALRLGGLPRRSLCFLSLGWSYKFGYFCDGKELYGGVEVLFFLGFGGGFVGAGGGEEKSFFGAIVLSTQCSDWLASTLETLLGFSGDHDFVKSFREGSKLLIAHRGENKAGRFLEAAAYGLGGRRGLILIPEGRGGWGWRKFSGELRTVSVSLSVGCGLGLSASDKKNGKVERAKLSTGLDSLGATEGFSFSGGFSTGVKRELALRCSRRWCAREQSTLPWVAGLLVISRVHGMRQRSLMLGQWRDGVI
jgi:hypothetical protein